MESGSMSSVRRVMKEESEPQPPGACPRGGLRLLSLPGSSPAALPIGEVGHPPLCRWKEIVEETEGRLTEGGWISDVGEKHKHRAS